MNHLTYHFSYSTNISTEDYDELIDQKHYNFLHYNKLWHDADMPLIRTAELFTLREDWIVVKETWHMDVSDQWLTENKAKKTAYYESLGMPGY